MTEHQDRASNDVESQREESEFIDPRSHALFIYIENDEEERRMKHHVLCKQIFFDMIPIFWAIRDRAEVKVLKKMVEIGGEEMLMIRKEDDENILHYAALMKASLEVFKCILNGVVESENILLQQDCLGNTPLHYACGWINNLEVIKYLVEKGGRNALSKKNKKKWVPYSKNPSVQDYLKQEGGENYVEQLKSQNFEEASYTLIELLKIGEIEEIESRLEQEDHQDLFETDRKGRTPLMLLLGYYDHAVSSFDKVKLASIILRMATIGESTLVQMKSNAKNNALHYAAFNNASLEIIKRLFELGGETTLQEQNQYGNSPLHDACSKMAHREVIDFLARNSGAKTLSVTNKKGCTPMDILLNDDKPSDSRIVALQQAWYDIDKKCAQNLPTEDVSKVLQWCKKDSSLVISNNFVKAILNERFILNRYFGTIMWDFFFQLVIIVALSPFLLHDIYESKNDGTERDVATSFILLLISTVYFGLRELLQFFSSDLEDYMKDHENFLDITQLILLFCTTIFLHDVQFDDVDVINSSKGVLAAAIGIAWLELLFVLGQLGYTFSVFTSAFVKIIIALIPFGMTSIILVSAFSQMFFIVGSGESDCICLDPANSNHTECVSGDFIAWQCTARSSFFHSFSMLLNSADSGFMKWDKYYHGDNNSNWSLLILSFIFSLVIVILLLNVLIAVVSNAFSEVESHSSDAFWTTRLTFMVEIDSIYNKFWSFNEKYDEVDNSGRTTVVSPERNCFWPILYKLYLSLLRCKITDDVIEDQGRENNSTKRKRRTDLSQRDDEWIYNTCDKNDRQKFFMWWYYSWADKKPNIWVRLTYFRKYALFKQIIFPGPVFTNIVFGLKYNEKVEGWYQLLMIPWKFLKYIFCVILIIGMLLYFTLGVCPLFYSLWSRDMKKILFFGPIDTKKQQASDEKASQEIEKKVDMLESQLNTLRTENHEMKSHLKVLRRESLLSPKLNMTK